jgi:chloramphenicol-sensitive protein RarD
VGERLETETVKKTREPMSDDKLGLLCVIGCQLFWGVCPIYWQALMPIPSWIIILYRIVTMFVYSYIAARLRFSREEVWGPLRDRAVRRKYFTAGLILTANWSTYIWAMTSGRVIQASIGYYIEPIVICAVGIIVFREKLTKYNLTAMLFALVAIILIIAHYRQIPGVALGLAATWAAYSAIKKTSDLPVLLTMVYETMIYAGISLIAILYIETHGIGAISMGAPGKYALMFLSGLITLIPVGLFSVSAKKVSLLVIGLAQYISPTMSLLLGIFLFKEPTDRVQLIAFLIIWIGLAIFTWGEIKNNKERSRGQATG